jgi:hypothetical protein
MLRNGRRLIILMVLMVSAGVVVGRHRQTQSPWAGKDAGSLIRDNMRSAVGMMRALSSAEVAYFATSGNGEFGNEANLFEEGLIDRDFANALGCPGMTSANGQTCAGTGAPLRGYHFRLLVTPSAPGRPPAFSAVGIPSVAEGCARMGAYSFFVDQTQVIRVSSNPIITANAKSPALGTSTAPEIRD